MADPFRIGFISVRFGLFDQQMHAGFPEQMRRHAARCIEVLGTSFDVVDAGMIEMEGDVANAANVLSSVGLDAIVFAPTMAAPPSYADAALRTATAPIVIWNSPGISELKPDLTQSDATEHTTTIGCLMYANVALRQGKAITVVTAALSDSMALATLIRTIRAVAAAGSLLNTTVLRVGEPIPGYLDVEASGSDLAKLGVRESVVSISEWEAAYEGVEIEAEQSYTADIQRAGWVGDPGPNMGRSARIGVALGRLLDDAGAIGGTINCHGPYLRQNERIGITGCLAVSCLTGAGRPLSCTGDQPTAIALYLARRLTGAALYCECYAVETETGLMLLAAGGEGDPAWAEPPGAVRLEAHDHYPGVRGSGVSVAFALRPGPATLISLSPTSENWVLAWATGEIVGTRYSNMRGPNGMFRFDGGPAQVAVSAWIASGATHHCALAPGRLDIEIPPLVSALGIEAVRI